MTSSPPMRILVTGNAGSGKSTVSALLSARLGLPLTSLDLIVWQPGWTRTPKDISQADIARIAARPAWVVDGVSSVLWRTADVVVFLDCKRRVSYLRCMKRNWRYLFRSRPGLPPHCPELLIIPELVRIIWRFPHHVRPKILDDFQHSQAAGRLIHVQSEAQLAACMEELLSHSS